MTTVPVPVIPHVVFQERRQEEEQRDTRRGSARVVTIVEVRAFEVLDARSEACTPTDATIQVASPNIRSTPRNPSGWTAPRSSPISQNPTGTAANPRCAQRAPRALPSEDLPAGQGGRGQADPGVLLALDRVIDDAEAPATARSQIATYQAEKTRRWSTNVSPPLPQPRKPSRQRSEKARSRVSSIPDAQDQHDRDQHRRRQDGHPREMVAPGEISLLPAHRVLSALGPVPQPSTRPEAFSGFDPPNHPRSGRASACLRNVGRSRQTARRIIKAAPTSWSPTIHATRSKTACQPRCPSHPPPIITET